MKKYCDPKPLLSAKDINGNTPAMVMIVSNRSDGKTTGVLKEMLEIFKETGKQFSLIYRNQYELSSANDIFEDVLNIYPQLGIAVEIKAHAKGLFYELILDEETCAWAFALHNPDAVKKYSPKFRDIDYAIMDEFQTETGSYKKDEIKNLESLLVTINRGGGKQARELRLILLSNRVSIMNPYFINWGIHKRIQRNPFEGEQQIIRGDDWILVLRYNEHAGKAIKESGIGRLFKNSDYNKYATEDVYLYDAMTFVCKPKGRYKYLFTLTYDGKTYGVREYWEEGVLHIGTKPEHTYPITIAVKANNHTQTTMMLSKYDYVWENIKKAYHVGALRFEDVECKNVIFDILAIDLFK